MARNYMTWIIRMRYGIRLLWRRQPADSPFFNWLSGLLAWNPEIAVNSFPKQRGGRGRKRDNGRMGRTTDDDERACIIIFLHYINKQKRILRAWTILFPIKPKYAMVHSIGSEVPLFAYHTSSHPHRSRFWCLRMQRPGLIRAVLWLHPGSCRIYFHPRLRYRVTTVNYRHVLRVDMESKSSFAADDSDQRSKELNGEKLVQINPNFRTRMFVYPILHDSTLPTKSHDQPKMAPRGELNALYYWRTRGRYKKKHAACVCWRSLKHQARYKIEERIRFPVARIWYFIERGSTTGAYATSSHMAYCKEKTRGRTRWL